MWTCYQGKKNILLHLLWGSACTFNDNNDSNISHAFLLQQLSIYMSGWWQVVRKAWFRAKCHMNIAISLIEDCFEIYRVLCKSPKPPLISLYFAFNYPFFLKSVSNSTKGLFWTLIALSQNALCVCVSLNSQGNWTGERQKKCHV